MFSCFVTIRIQFTEKLSHSREILEKDECLVWAEAGSLIYFWKMLEIDESLARLRAGSLIYFWKMLEIDES